MKESASIGTTPTQWILQIGAFLKWAFLEQDSSARKGCHVPAVELWLLADVQGILIVQEHVQWHHSRTHLCKLQDNDIQYTPLKCNMKHPHNVAQLPLTQTHAH